METDEQSGFEDYFHNCSDTKMDCDLSNKHKHCKLCNKTFTTPFRRKRHFIQSHVNRAVPYHGKSCYPCKLSHDNLGKSERFHYHCPVCQCTILNQEPFIKHLKLHDSKEPPKIHGDCEMDTKSDSNEIVTDDEEDGSSADHEKYSDDGSIISRRAIPEMKECSICGKSMRQKSLARHYRDIHDKEIVRVATCVDEDNGIFLVRNSSRGGVGYPVHVKKVMGSENAGIQCEKSECMDYMQVAWRSGITTAECKHLQEVGKNPVFPESITLSSETIEDLSPSGEYRMLTEERITECKELQFEARRKNCECIVSMTDGTRFIHLSVFDGNVNYFSKFGRVIVTADVENGTLDCRCCRRRRLCIHKSICYWYFRQENLLDAFRDQSTEIEDDEPAEEDFLTPQLQSANQIYPPNDPSIVAKMCRYLHSYKRIPLFDANPKNKVTTAFCRKFIPKETHCQNCQSSLSAPVLISNKATLLTMNDVIDGIETFYKRCENCRMCYRYQENDRNIHNFNDTFLIGFDVCRFLRQCLQEHLPIGSIVNVLESQLGKRLHSQSVIDAYLHFDSLSLHSYEYSCTLCGYHPKILIMDLNKKVAFNCNVSNLELPENYQMDDADLVDCDEFWGKVELSMILRGFSNRTIPEFEVNPNLLSWSPFIGRNTRKGPLLLNTEHRKVSRSTGELESDCKEISEERLLELLHNSTYKEVKKFAQSISAHPKGSKLDVTMQIKQAISKDDEKFKKAFKKIWGRSGGWVSGTCQHGVIYALKFVLRAESPRDYIDLILSMAHQPNIVVSDMANMLVAHGQKRNKHMFNPHNGMVAAPTKDNVQEALEGRLEVSLPWLNENRRNGDGKCITTKIHPVTGSDQHLCLFDRLHERNAKKDEEALRRVRNVKELKGTLNTQKDEQLHLLYNHDTRYLNQMKPVNHIFLFRSNIDIHNERINRRQIDGLRAAFKHEIKVDENGRAVLDKTIKIVVKGKGHQKRNIAGDMDDDAQHATPKKMKPESSDPATPNMMEPESSRESVSGTENEPTDTQQATPKKMDPESSHESVSVTENQHTDTQQATTAKTESKSPQLSGFGIKNDAIDVDATLQRPLSLDDCYWIKDLGLKNRDKHLITNDYWLNDRVINAAMKLMRKIAPNLAGLADVILAKKDGFPQSLSVDGFVQIVNVRGNHWITLSNAQNLKLEVSIYDSLHGVDKNKDNKIRYPISVEQSVCQIMRPPQDVTFLVDDVQQQEGGNDCGLFAIAFATLLCVGRDPAKERFDQKIMREELLQSFEKQDMALFVEKACSTSRKEDPEILYEWHCPVYCHCRMPDDGNEMVQCIACKRWFHGKCETGNFNSLRWRCKPCQDVFEREQKRESERKKNEDKVQQLRCVAAKYPVESKRVQELYTAIAGIYQEFQFPDGKTHIGCMSAEDHASITKDTTRKLGCTHYLHAPKYDFFIVIFHEELETDASFLSVVLHEMAHSEQGATSAFEQPHGKLFKKIGKRLIKCVKSRQAELPKPYCNVAINEVTVLTAKC